MLGAGEGVSRVLGVLAYAALARVLTVDEFGIFTYAMTLGLLFGVLVDFGQNALVGRAAARDTGEGGHIVSAAVSNKLMVGALLAAGGWAGARLLGVSSDEAIVIALMIVWAAALSALDAVRGFGRSRGMMVSDSIINGSESLLRVASVLAAWFLGLRLVGVAFAFASASLVALFVYLWFVASRHPGHIPTRVPVKRRLAVFAEAAPLGLSAIAMAGFYRLDQVFVRTLAGSEQSAYYGAAARIVFTAGVVAIILAWAAYPELSRASHDKRAFRAVLKRSLGLAVAAGAIGTVLIAVGAEPLLVAIYGQPYAAVTDILRVLSFVVLFNAVSVIALQAANALHLDRRVMVIASVLVAINIVLNVLLVPIFGAMAAAALSVAGEAALAAALLAAAVRATRAESS